MMEIRDDFLDLFQIHGISRLQLHQMPDYEFEAKLNEFLDDRYSNGPNFHSQFPNGDDYGDNGGINRSSADRSGNHAFDDDELNAALAASLEDAPAGLYASNSRSPRNRTQQNQRPSQIRHPPSYGANLSRAAMDGFGNGDLDEEAAMKAAIEASLDDMLIAPHLRPRPDPRNEIVHPDVGGAISRNKVSNYHPKVGGIPKELQPKPTPLPSTKKTTNATRTNARQVTGTKAKEKPLNSRLYVQHNAPAVPAPSGNSRRPTTTSKPRINSSSSNTSVKSRNATNATKPKPSANARNPPNAKRPTFGEIPPIHAREPINSRPSSQRTVPKAPASKGGVKKTTPGSTAQKRANPQNQFNNPPPSFSTKQEVKTKPKADLPTRTRSDGTKGLPHHIPPRRGPIELPAAEIIREAPRVPPKKSVPVRETFEEPIADEIAPHDHNSYFHAQNGYIDQLLEYEKKFDEIDLPPPAKIDSPQPSKALSAAPAEMRKSHNERNLQDLEYEQILQEAEREEEEKRKKEEEERQKMEEMQKEQDSKESKLRNILQSIPPEPQNGTTIAVVLFNKRVMRRFSPDEDAIHVYAWITSESGGQLDLDSFELAPVGGEKLIKGKSLEEQNIKGRIMLSIIDL